MPPKKKSKTYNENDLLEAIAAVKTNLLSTRGASERYGIPQSTLMDKLKDRYAPTVLKRGK